MIPSKAINSDNGPTLGRTPNNSNNHENSSVNRQEGQGLARRNGDATVATKTSLARKLRRMKRQMFLKAVTQQQDSNDESECRTTTKAASTTNASTESLRNLILKAALGDEGLGSSSSTVGTNTTAFSSVSEGLYIIAEDDE